MEEVLKWLLDLIYLGFEKRHETYWQQLRLKIKQKCVKKAEAQKRKDSKRPWPRKNAKMLGLAHEADKKLIEKNNNKKAKLLGSAHVKHLIGPG